MDVTSQVGSGEFSWDGKNNYGQTLPSSTYIINFFINDEVVDEVKVVKR